MLFIFFTLAFSYNIWRGDCQAIIDQYKYDLTSFNDFLLSYQTELFSYYMRLCPDYRQEETIDVFLMLCPKSSGSNCIYALTQNSFDFKPRNPKNFSEGVIYYASSEPFRVGHDEMYRTVDIEYDLICDPSITNITGDMFTIIVDESQIGSVFMRARTAAACPQLVASPSPTPEYQPKCDFMYRVDGNETFGVDGNLNNLNNGPFGIKTKLMIDGKEKFLFYQPCERMLCPPTYNCSTDNFSSEWLCQIASHPYSRSCKSYGVVADFDNIHPLDSNRLQNGMPLRFEDPTTNKSSNLTILCNKNDSFLKGHIK